MCSERVGGVTSLPEQPGVGEREEVDGLVALLLPIKFQTSFCEIAGGIGAPCYVTYL